MSPYSAQSLSSILTSSYSTHLHVAFVILIIIIKKQQQGNKGTCDLNDIVLGGPFSLWSVWYMWWKSEEPIWHFINMGTKCALIRSKWIAHFLLTIKFFRDLISKFNNIIRTQFSMNVSLFKRRSSKNIDYFTSEFWIDYVFDLSVYYFCFLENEKSLIIVQYQFTTWHLFSLMNSE